MDGEPPSFYGTSRLAGEKAAIASSSRRARIMHLINVYGPMAIFEIAEKMNVHDHQISGRFGEMLSDGLLAKTGERRIKPGTQCEAEVYALRPDDRDPRDAADLLGYPPSIKIANEGVFSRGPIIGDQDLPGIPYAMTGAGLHLSWRVEFVECPGCGRTLKFVEKGQFACNTPSCHRTWFPLLVNEAGKSPVLALVMKFM